MTNPAIENTKAKIKVGLFSLAGLILIGAVTVLVNDRPFWWRGCERVYINVEDATGLKAKSPIRSLGLQIGYLESIELSETHVRLGICVTAPVEVLGTTRAYIRGEGFLGDKFVELRPVRYFGGPRNAQTGGAISVPERPAPEITPASPKPTSLLDAVETEQSSTEQEEESEKASYPLIKSSLLPAIPLAVLFVEWVSARAQADEAAQAAQSSKPINKGSKEVPVGRNKEDLSQVVNQVDTLVSEMTELTKNLKDAIDPKELRNTMTQLNKTLENASRTLSPEGGLNTTAQRTLAKLEEAIENLRDIMTRVNKGEGSIGMLINDPVYAEEIREAVRNVNRLLGRVSELRLIVDVGGEQINGYDGGRAWFTLALWPRKDRYYLVGATVDPRGKRTLKTFTTTAGGVTTRSQVEEVEDGGLLFNLMLGKVFLNRLDLSLGLLHGDGTGSVALRLGPMEREEMIVIRNDLYTRGKDYGMDDRISLILKPFPRSAVLSTLYVRGGIESFKKLNGKLAYAYGAGISFDDQDIKLLFALR